MDISMIVVVIALASFFASAVVWLELHSRRNRREGLDESGTEE